MAETNRNSLQVEVDRKTGKYEAKIREEIKTIYKRGTNRII